MRIGSTRHGDCIFIVRQAISCLISNGCLGGFFFHAEVEAAALDHEAVDYAMEQRIVIKSAVHIVEEIFDGNWRFFSIQFDGDIAVVSMQFDHADFSFLC